MLYLKIINALRTPIWIFDIENKALVWGNESAVKVWDMESLDALKKRDFTPEITDTTQIRLNDNAVEFAHGRTRTDVWTHYPHGVARTMVLQCSGIEISGAESVLLGFLQPWEAERRRTLMLVEARCLEDKESQEYNLREIEALRETNAMIALFDMETLSVLTQNPASLAAFGPVPSFTKLFACPSESQRIMSDLEKTSKFKGDVLVTTTRGTVWHHMDARVARDPLSGKRTIITNHDNIHDVRVAHGLLLENERLLQETQELANMGSWELSLTDTISTKASRQFYHILGLGDTPLSPSQPLHLLIMEEFGAPVVREAINGTGPRTFDFTLTIQRRDNDEQRVVQVRGEVLVNACKTPIRVLGTIQDVTEIQAAHDKFDRERKFVEALIGCLKASIVAVNSEGVLTHVNSAAQNLHGLTLNNDTDSQQVLDTLIGCYKDPVDKKRLDRDGSPIIRALSGETMTDHELIVSPVNDEVTEHVVLVSGQEIVSSDGTTIGAVIAMHDITDRKHFEEELTQAMEQAEEADRLKSEFLNNISHELLSPMNSILGNAGLCLEMAPANIKEMLHDVVDSSNIDTALPDDLVGDNNRLKQIVSNLLDNAIKFSDKDQPSNTVHIRVKMVANSAEDSSDTTTIQFSVQDNGVGIPDEKRSYILDNFYQVDGSYSRSQGGVGLGLPVVNSLVKFFGGTLWFESEIGKGSTFYFTVKLRRSESRRTNHSPRTPLSPVTSHSTVAGDIHIHATMSPKDESRASRLHMLANSQRACLSQSIDSINSRVGCSGSLPHMTVASLAPRCSSPNPTPPHSPHLNMLRQTPPMSPSMQHLLPSSALSTSSTSSSSETKPKTKDPIARLGHRVLVAEDNAMNQKLIKTLLDKRGFDVEIANDGKEALEMYEGGRYDCILMDMSMPVLNGLETTEAIRDRERADGSHIPIIAVTAHALKGDKEKFLEAGVDDYVTKPINPKLLYEIIQSQVMKKLSSLHRPLSPIPQAQTCHIHT
eukprot:gene224-273_t